MCVTLNDVTAEGLTPGRNGKFISFRKHFPNGQDRAAVHGNIALCGRGNGSAWESASSRGWLNFITFLLSRELRGDDQGCHGMAKYTNKQKYNMKSIIDPSFNISHSLSLYLFWPITLIHFDNLVKVSTWTQDIHSLAQLPFNISIILVIHSPDPISTWSEWKYYFTPLRMALRNTPTY